MHVYTVYCVLLKEQCQRNPSPHGIGFLGQEIIIIHAHTIHKTVCVAYCIQPFPLLGTDHWKLTHLYTKTLTISSWELAYISEMLTLVLWKLKHIWQKILKILNRVLNHLLSLPAHWMENTIFKMVLVLDLVYNHSKSQLSVLMSKQSRTEM